MTRYITILLLSLFFNQLHAQSIRGVVYESGTTKPISHASIYYNNSLTGTITDDYGNFKIDAKPGKIALNISCVGYVSHILNDYTPDTEVKIYLSPKVNTLNEININDDGLPYADKLRIFQEEFIGTSKFARSCIILNPDDIYFKYDKQSSTLRAFCDKPIEIDNKKLGYHISYYLNLFQRSPQHMVLIGNSKFQESIESDQQGTIVRNREEVYRGSRMQFIRALWFGSLTASNFELYTATSKKLNPDSILIAGPNQQKFVKLKDGIIIRYIDNYQRITKIAKTDSASFIDMSGFSDTNLKWSGDMGYRRVGDMLPFEYNSLNEHYSELTKDIKTKNISDKKIQDKVDTIANKFSVDYFEGIYLHIDKDYYNTGENIWFKAYLINPRTHKLTGRSNTLYVELISPDLKILDRRLIRLDQGIGNGNIGLSDTLKDGVYRIRAYTNYMRNFDNDFIFERQIKISGRLAGEAVKSNKNRISNDRKIPNLVIVEEKETIATLGFYPEGGSLVNGVRSKVGVKAENALGKGMSSTGSIVSNSGFKAAEFSCDSLGFGAFSFSPEKNQNYYAEIVINGIIKRYPVPKALSDGVTMAILRKNGFLNISLICAGLNLNVNKKYFNLRISNRGNIFYRKNIFLSKENTIIEIPNKNFPEGISIITLLNSATPVAERLVYVNDSKSLKVNITTDKSSYNNRDKVNVSFKLNDTTLSNISMAVISGRTRLKQGHSFKSYVNLTSELKGYIESPGRYFDTTNVNRSSQMDILLLTQGWRNYIWERASTYLAADKFPAETGITLTGRVRQIMRDKPISNLSVTMFAPKALGQKLFDAKTDSVGNFSFHGSVFYGYQYISFTSRDANRMKEGQSIGRAGGWIQIDSLNQNVATVYPNKEIADFNNAEIEYNKKRSKLDFAGNNQLNAVQIKSRVSSRVETHLIGPPERNKYNNLARYLLDVIPGSHEEIGGCKIFADVAEKHNVLNFGYFPQRKITFSASYTDNSKIDLTDCDEVFLEQPMTNILKVQIVRTNMVKGAVLIVHLILKPGSLEKKTFDNTVADVTGYSRAKEFYSPKYPVAKSSPDDRSTIHWEPNIVTKNGVASVSFYNSDLNGTMQIVVQGINKNGEAISSVVEYTVK